MVSRESDLTDYEVSFIVSTEKKSDHIRMVKPDYIMYKDSSEKVVIKVKADSEEMAEEKAYALLTDPAGQYVKKYGPGFEVKKNSIWQIWPHF